MLAGENRDGKIAQRRTPASSQARMIASHRGTVTSSGFSTTTCLPARAASTAGSRWAPLGVQMQTTSSPGMGEHRVEVVEDRAPADGQAGDLWPRSPGTGLNAATSRAPGISAIARAWNSAIIPQPTIAEPVVGHRRCSGIGFGDQTPSTTSTSTDFALFPEPTVTIRPLATSSLASTVAGRAARGRGRS